MAKKKTENPEVKEQPRTIAGTLICTGSNLSTPLTGFGSECFPDLPKLRDWRYCNQSMDKNDKKMPYCRMMEGLYGDLNNNFDDMLIPPDFTKPPQPKTNLEHQLGLIGQIQQVLLYWLKEAVRPDESSPAFWYYVYADIPCKQRALTAAGFANLLVQSLKYDYPLIVSELNRCFDILLKKAVDFDEHLKLMRQRGFVEMNPRIYNPTTVKQAAFALCDELLRIYNWLIEADQKGTPKELRSKPLSLTQWSKVFDVGKDKIKEMAKNPKYHFKQNSPRKWTLPLNELPAEYLQKYTPKP